MTDQGQAGAAPLVLANMTIGDVGPIELIDAAAAGGFDAITLRIVAPSPQHAMVPVIGNEALLRQIEARLGETGVMVQDIGGVWFAPDTDVKSFLPALETGRRLGARNFMMGANDPDEARVTDNLALFCELAQPFGIKAMVEFIPYNHTRSLVDACRIVSAAGAGRAGVVVDALHLDRSGSAPADVALVDPALIAYCQICDAVAERPALADLPAEARAGRLYPGLGVLPLYALLDAIPPGTPIGVEAPMAAYADLSPIEKGRLCGLATRVFLNLHQRRGGSQ